MVQNINNMILLKLSLYITGVKLIYYKNTGGYGNNFYFFTLQYIVVPKIKVVFGG